MFKDVMETPPAIVGKTAPSLADRSNIGESPIFPTDKREALAALLQARDYAQDTQSDIWDFAVEIAALQAAGLEETDFRWLVRKGYVEHRVEETGANEISRRFAPGSTESLCFTPNTCFILTDEGVAFLARGPQCANCPAIEHATPVAVGSLRPKWDPDRHELKLNGEIVKKYRQPAPNQEIILAAFEEEGWPAKIWDPLLPTGNGKDPKERLRDTIRCLNNSQKQPLIRFHGDGTGQAVIWEVAAAVD